MISIDNAGAADKSFWFSIDKHMPEAEFEPKLRDKRCYIISDDGDRAGIMRYNLFWDNTPFLTLIYLEEKYRERGIGKAALLYWENEMRRLGYKFVMTSTQADENAQHFYRKLGYIDAGCLVANIPQFEQPLEIFMIKVV